jgi:hypothetical protein
VCYKFQSLSLPLVVRAQSSLIEETSEDAPQCLHNRQYVGSFDDILGLALTQSVADTDMLSFTSQPSPFPLLPTMSLAVVSNSPVVHVLSHNAESIPLVGHTDTVLAVQASPDG